MSAGTYGREERLLEPMELEVDLVVNPCYGFKELNLDPLQEQSTLTA